MCYCVYVKHFWESSMGQKTISTRLLFVFNKYIKFHDGFLLMLA